MSPMFTLCHEERRSTRGGRPALAAAAKTAGEIAAVAAAETEQARKWRRFMGKGA